MGECEVAEPIEAAEGVGEGRQTIAIELELAKRRQVSDGLGQQCEAVTAE